jgi:hypothetical protein
VKIVSRGRRPEEITWRGTCFHCKSVLEASRKEMASVYAVSQREPGEIGTAACPVCGDAVSFYPIRGEPRPAPPPPAAPPWSGKSAAR